MTQMRRSVDGSRIKHSSSVAEKKESLGVLVKVTILNRKISGDTILFAVALDIGSSGILIESDRSMLIGEKIKCTFILRHKISVTGEIVKAVQTASGVFHYEVRLFDVDPNALAQLEDLASQ